MKIKEIEEIVSENMEKREKEIRRKFTEKETAVAILNEQLKLMEFDPGYYFGVRSAEEIHKENMQKLTNEEGKRISTEEEVGEIEVPKQTNCKILSIIYKYIADKHGLDVYFMGKERGCENMTYKKYSELQATTPNEHIYTVVKLQSSFQELKVDVQDEEQVMKRRGRPRNLGGRISDIYLFTDQLEELEEILTAIGYIKPGQEYSDVYASNMIKNTKNKTRTEYENVKMIIEDEYLKEALKNSGVASSYRFYKQQIKNMLKSQQRQEGEYYVLPCYLKRQGEGKEQIFYSYFIFLQNGEQREIYMYSDKEGGLVKITPELVKQMTDANLKIGHGQYTMEDAQTREGIRRLNEYVINSTNQEQEGQTLE